MNYIICKDRTPFEKIGEFNYCNLEDMILPDMIAIDTETTGLTPRNCDVFCVQIGTGENCYLIKMYDDNYIFQDLIPYIDGKVLVGHNILFDLGFFYKYDFWPREVRDTMLASKILHNGDPRERHDFGHVMKREMDITYDKTEQKNIHLVKLSQASTIAYSFNDVDRLLDLHSVLYNKLDERGSLPTYKLHYRYVRALAYMEQCGLPISSEKWNAKMDEDVNNSFKWKQTIEEYIYDNLPKYADNQLNLFEGGLKKIKVSVNSAKQMLHIFNAFGIPTIDKDGKDSINENVISKSKHEFVEMWLNYQVANHRVTTFGESIYNRIENERIYTNFNPMVDTARLSTRRGNINFLNFPADKTTRYCFKANEGNVMIVCDYSGQETVIVADLSGDEAMTKSVVEGADLHCLLARVLFPEIEHLSDEEIVKNHKDKRNASKAPRFAMSYGGNAFTIHMNEGIPLKRAQEIEDGFKNLHSGLYAWGDRVFQSSIKTGYIESVDGWKLRLPFYEDFVTLKAKVDSISRDDWTQYKIGKNDFKKKFEELEKGREYTYQFPKSVELYNEKKVFVSKYFKLRSEYLRLCLNNPVQARAAHQLKLATVLLFDWIIENNYQWKVLLCNSIHDEIVLEVPEDMAEEVTPKLGEFMVTAANHYLKNLTMKADANYGSSWGEAK